MTNQAYNTVVLKHRGFRKEGLAAGTVTPGMLVKQNSTDGYIAHNVAGGKALFVLAVENELKGADITVNYASGDTLFAEVLPRGAEAQIIIAAGAAAISKGDLLESAGDGTFRKARDLTAAAGTPVATGIIADVGGSPSQATINNGFATVASLVDYPGALCIAKQAIDNSGGGSAVNLVVEVL